MKSIIGRILPAIKNIVSFFTPKVSRLDLQRYIFMTGLVIFCFYDDPTTLNILQFVFGFLIAISLITHLMRKALLPYIDMEKVYNKAVSSAEGAAVLGLGVCVILATSIFVAGQFFNK